MSKKKAENKVKITALYCRLSVEDTKDLKDKRKKSQEDESNSISNQKQILLDYAKKNGYLHTEFFVDDGISGTTFDRPDFQRMQRMVENGEIAAVVINDEATLKRVYYYPQQNKLILAPENARFAPLSYSGAELETITILGKAVAFQSAIR